MRRVIFLFFILMGSNAFAGGIGSKLNSHLSKMTGGTVNVTNPAYYKSQAAGYFSGGSVVARTPIVNQNLVNVKLPSYKSGCGGIDLFNGGLGFVDAKQLVETAQAIGKNAGGFAFHLALATASPLWEKEVSKLQEWAQKANAFNINSCETASVAVGGLWPKHERASEAICAKMANYTGGGKSYVQARHGCRSERGKKLNDMKDSAEYQKVKLTDVNLAWRAIKESGLSIDNDMKETLMSLSGTVIILENGGSPEFKYYPSKMMDEEFINTLLLGGKSISYYACESTDQCLAMEKDKKKEISVAKSFVGEVKKRIRSIVKSIRAGNTALSKEDENLVLNVSSFPLFNTLEVMAQYSGGSAIFELDSYSEPIAASLLYEYLTKLLNRIEVASLSLMNAQEEIESFKDGIKAARRELERRERNRKYNMNQLHRLRETTLMMQSLIGKTLGDKASVLIQPLEKLH